MSPQSEIKDMVSMEAKMKWQCPKCGVGLRYNATYKIEGLCSACRTYEDSDRLPGVTHWLSITVYVSLFKHQHLPKKRRTPNS